MQRFGKSRAAWGAVWLTLAVLLMALSLSALVTALPGAAGIARLSGRYDGDGPLFSAMKRLRREAGAQAAVTAWTQRRGETVEVEVLGATLTVDALLVDGDADAVMNAKPLRGGMPAFDGARVAALSRDAALRLFGSLEVIGQPILYDGKQYQVTCVFERPTGWRAPAADPDRALVMLPAAAHPDGDDAKLIALEWLFTAGFSGNAQQSVERWMGLAGLRTPDRTEDWADTRNLGAFLSRLPWLLMALMGAVVLALTAGGVLQDGAARFAALRADRLTEQKYAWRALGAAAALAGVLAALGIAMCVLAGGLPTLPPAYIPSRWSDLSFWPTLAEQSLAGVAQGALRATLRPDLERHNLAALSAALALLAVPALLLARRALSLAPARAPNSWGWALAAAILAPPLALLIARRIGYAAAAPPSAFILPAAFAAALLIRSYIEEARPT